MALLLRAALLLFTAQVLSTVSGCKSHFYKTTIEDLCLGKFHLDMERLDPGLWCSWPDTTENLLLSPLTGYFQDHYKTMYEGLTNCTYQVALRLDCFWPNQVVDDVFVQIHNRYFHACALTGRLLHDPPIAILAPFITVPVVVTLLMTALVVWRSRCTQGVL